MKKVAIVFGTYNRFELLKKAVASVRSSVDGLSYDMIVVDGGSNDGSREWLAEQMDVVLIGQRGPLTGAVKAFNLGFGHAVDNGYEYVFHFNDDAELLPCPLRMGSIDLAAGRLDEDASVGEVAFELDLRGKWDFEYVHGKVYGNFGLIRTKAGIEVAKAQGDATGRNWWNPIYRTYGADSEFGCWLHKLGWKIHEGRGLRVHDVNAKDQLRAINTEPVARQRDGNLFWSRWPTPESMLPSGAINVNWKDARVHVGCGTKRLRGWINVDALQVPAADVVMDFSEGVRNIPTGSLRELYWSHGPEHVHPDKLPGMLREMRRAMADGGRFTVGTIDLEGIYENRFKTNRNGPNWNSALYGETDSSDPHWASHKQCFTYDYLSKLLRDAGFTNMRRWQPELSPEIAALNDYTMSCRLVTVAIEATAGGQDLESPKATVPEVTMPMAPRRWDAAALRDGVIVPEVGVLAPRLQKGQMERVLHVALRTPSEPQLGMERALRSIANVYEQVDWIADERLGQAAGVASLLAKAHAAKPTLVFMQMQRASFITSSVVKKMRELCDPNVVIINWDGDQHYEPSEGHRAWFVELGRECDTSLVVNTKHPAEYRALGVRNPGYLQIGVDGELFRPVNVPKTDQVVLLASHYSNVTSYGRRVRAVGHLQSTIGSRFSVYGHGWVGWPSGRNLLHTTQEAAIYSAASAALSMSIRADLPRYTSDRLLRMLCSGALPIVEKFPDCEGLGLVDGKNCILWDGDLRQLDIILGGVSVGSHQEMRRAAADLGAKEHTWDIRVGDLLEVVRLVRSLRT